MVYTSPYALAPPTVDVPTTPSIGPMGQANAGLGIAAGAASLASRFKKSKAPLKQTIQRLKKQDPQTYFQNESKFKKLARQQPKVSGFLKALGPALQIGGSIMAFTPMAPVAIAAIQAGAMLASKYSDKAMQSDLRGQMQGLQKDFGRAQSEATGQPMQRQPSQPQGQGWGGVASDLATAASPFIKNPIAQASIRSVGNAAAPQPTPQRAMGFAAPWLNRSIYA